ncbi:hypothetical protein JEQ21_06790 [Streptococcus sp. 121]|uniref:hypothetical protein n=1 Tax=Streptococcus sp. 121 TaxID=2797637 RepID=UPI0018F0EB65|nr:hypothetical protein [Streptococcus sp. 121]MBJ6746162.1 hypothetical protein [Streptococcus sp. 121]
MLEFYKEYFDYLVNSKDEKAAWKQLIDDNLIENAVDIMEDAYQRGKAAGLYKTKEDFFDEIFGDTSPSNVYEALYRWRREGFPPERINDLTDLDKTSEIKSKLWFSLVTNDLLEQEKFHEVSCALEIGELVVKSKLYDVIRMAIKTNIKKGSVEEVGYEEFLRNFKDSISSAISFGLMDYHSQLDWCDPTEEELEVGLDEEDSPETLEAFTPKFVKKKIENGELDI